MGLTQAPYDVHAGGRQQTVTKGVETSCRPYMPALFASQIDSGHVPARGYRSSLRIKETRSFLGGN